MSKALLSKEDADKVAVTFSPRKFPAVITRTAHDFVKYNSNNPKTDSSGSPSFRIDRLVAEQTGVAELERISLEEKVEREALVRLKEFQEQAFQQAYQLGLDEGRERAFVERSGELSDKLAHLQDLLETIENVKSDLIACNETQIVRMVFYMAKRLVYQEISAKPELVLETVRQALLSAQSDENVNIRISPSDYELIESTREKLGKEFDGVKRAKLEASPEIENGGCVVETNYGDVNATLEQRLARIWESLSEKLPKTKSGAIASGAAGSGDGSGTATGSGSDSGSDSGEES